MVTLAALEQHLAALLSPQNFQDYCPNGLQVEGKPEINTVVSGVTACQALLDAAVQANADAILVHHGYFWRGEQAIIKASKKQRLKTLLEHNISLLAYHLPLDAHPQFGNNVQLAKQLGLQISGGLQSDKPLDSNIGLIGQLNKPVAGQAFADFLNQQLGRKPTHINAENRLIDKIAWCTGAGQSFIEQAIEQGVDAYLTGEISEPTTHLARENNIHFFAAGHHATERYGVASLGNHLAEQFAINHQFIDIDNPA
jgi:dinuclear metal center YbgI/SA1388 family protein